MNKTSKPVESWWIEEINLLLIEKDIILSGKWLSEPFITANNVLLAKQFKHLCGGACRFSKCGMQFHHHEFWYRNMQVHSDSA